jgi:hypothetical protein
VSGLDGGTGNRANQLGAVPHPKTKTKWFDPKAFSQPAPMNFGNAGKNPVTVQTPMRNEIANNTGICWLAAISDITQIWCNLE